MSDGERVHKFLTEHRDADVIVYDTRERLPVQAVYLTVRGVPRVFPAVFWFDLWECTGKALPEAAKEGR